MEQAHSSNQSSKFAFFYMFSLVALAFMAVSTGMVIFQIINKRIIDVLAAYGTCYSSDALKFAISAIIISAPIYYALAWQINKNLFSGDLKGESEIRKWLTYLIIFISSIVALGCFVAIIYNFLDGELTVKFALKAVAALAIAGTIFSFYLYEIRRDVVAGAKDRVLRIYFFATLAAIIIILISGFIFVESPNQTRLKKLDQEILEDFNSIKYAIENFYQTSKRLPEDFNALIKADLIKADNIKNRAAKNNFEYYILGDNKYKICADFQTSNKGDKENCYDEWLDKEWSHDSGYQCFEKTLITQDDGFEPTDEMPAPKPLPIN